MTSKEALELVRNRLNWESRLFVDELNIIKQDLEILEVLISILQKFIDEEEYFVLHDKYLSLGIDGSINITQQQCDVLKSMLKFKEKENE